jgi:hypothetical protein
MSTMGSTGSPLNDPAVARRAHRMMLAVLAVIGVLLVVRSFIGTTVGTGEAARNTHGFGMVYVERAEQGFVSERVTETGKDGVAVEVTKWKPIAPGQKPEVAWTNWNETTGDAWATASMKDAAQSTIEVSWSRTVGVWAAAIMTLCVFSFLWRDNPGYKLAESVVIGVSAGYWMVVALWDTLVPKLVGALAPGWTKTNLMPSFDAVGVDWWALVPLGLGLLLLCRLSSRASWLGVFPLAFIVGTFAGLKFVQYVEADLVAQVATMFDPLVVVKHQAAVGADAATIAASPIDWAGSVGASLAAILIFVGVLTVLAYFFFSAEHKGALGRTAKVGVWYLMITFGASFGFTVMGRIALLAARFEFVFDDWLWLIDPAGKH